MSKTSDDPRSLAAQIERLRAAQSMPRALAAGIVAAAAGAAIWASATIAIDGREWGPIALVVGLMVAFAVRFAGRGVSMPFGVVAASLALVGCLVGKYVALAHLYASYPQNETTMAEVLMRPRLVGALIDQNMSWTSVLMLGLAALEGWWFGFDRMRDPRA